MSRCTLETHGCLTVTRTIRCIGDLDESLQSVSCVGLIIGMWQLLAFLQRRSDRRATEQQLLATDHPVDRGVASGALPELLYVGQRQNTLPRSRTDIAWAPFPVELLTLKRNETYQASEHC
jgi:hypothetical protein